MMNMTSGDMKQEHTVEWKAPLGYRNYNNKSNNSYNHTYFHNFSQAHQGRDRQEYEYRRAYPPLGRSEPRHYSPGQTEWRGQSEYRSHNYEYRLPVHSQDSRVRKN